MEHTFVAIVFAIVLITGCANQGVGNVGVSGLKNNTAIEKLEIYHFHAAKQCASCIAVGNLAEETVNTYFADELKSGRIVFGHINGELPENKDLVTKYGVTGSSLWLGSYTKDGQFHAEENVNVWYKISDKSDYMTYLKSVIEQKLAGN